ncbi:MAG: PDC sensor domain-containing protein, partial [Clostridia bacterium]|nr:PDC sensor domain-containing protein [Clostridia bacterium]
MKKLFIKNFKTKLAIFLIIASLIPIAALEVISFYDGVRYQQHVFNRLEHEEIEGQIKLFDYWMANSQKDITVMVDMFEEYVARDVSAKMLGAALDLLLLRNDNIINTYYTNEDGLNIVSGGQSYVVDGRNRKWYKDAVERKWAISMPYEDALTSEYVITISHKILKAGELEGVLGFDILFNQVMDK